MAPQGRSVFTAWYTPRPLPDVLDSALPSEKPFDPTFKRFSAEMPLPESVIAKYTKEFSFLSSIKILRGPFSDKASNEFCSKRSEERRVGKECA